MEDSRLRINAHLYASLAADASALDMPTSQVATMLLCEALERARARRYAPYRLPEGYDWDAFGKAYSADENATSGDGQVTPIRRARKTAR
jgi:hypothetical protein